MKKLIVEVFEIIYALIFMGVVIFGGIIGNKHFADYGFIIGAMIACAACSLAFGPIFLLLLINENIAALRKHFIDE